jgi:hypothetical protein
LERHEAAILLKEIIDLSLAQPSSVSLKENKNGTFALILYSEYNLPELKHFITKKGLIFETAEEKGYCAISKP